MTTFAFFLALLCAAPGAVTHAPQDPVTWSATVVSTGLRPGGRFDVAITAVAEDEWHVYSVTQGPGGPIPTTIALARSRFFAPAGAIRGPVPARAFDPNFEIATETYEGTFTLLRPVRLAADAPGTGATLRLEVGFQACTKRVCLPPTTIALAVPVKWEAEVRGASRDARTATLAPDPIQRDETPRVPARTLLASPASHIAPPVSFGAGADSWASFLWLAVSMGALSLLTPCVFPMVPITVSYFTKHAESTRARAAGSAALYGLGIVLTFTLFGSVLAAVAGAAGLNRFAANPWVNLALTALFLIFALNLFGLYELRLPAGLLSRLDGESRRRGTSAAGTLLMALTFTITSLTCTAAFIGTLLVVAAQGEWQRPIAGLLVYSATFALPFVVLAMAPQLVSQLPRSGPWLTRVKVAMGVLEIAAALKFLSNADLVWSWGLLTRGAVLAGWTILALALAAYFADLPAWRRTGRHAPPGRIAAACASLALAVWLGTGISGRRLGELEAFLPPFDYARGRPAAVHAASNELTWITNDLDAALAEARASARFVLIDFTGYTCTNCRWMEANMFPRPEVRAALDTFVRARLYTDGRGPVYERQQRLQQEQFKTVALPLYAIVDADRRSIATFAGLTRDQGAFLAFLHTARP